MLLPAQEEMPDKRLRSAADTLHEIMAKPDRAIPRGLLNRAQCIVVVPGMMKAAFLIGGEYGRGYALYRTGSRWSARGARSTGRRKFRSPARGVDGRGATVEFVEHSMAAAPAGVVAAVANDHQGLFIALAKLQLTQTIEDRIVKGSPARRKSPIEGGF
jgi:hypothetical protein